MMQVEGGKVSCGRSIVAGAAAGVLGCWYGGPQAAIIGGLGGALIGAAGGCF